ncbi:hypothetical protein NIIDMKKI_61410 [Mycobacterium kansasii]|uniref:Uncharacterized protein n=1 Tax=Mycobacterium kansasii TaxID=1768 RepID=A0A7G1IMB3_MYCKA|nr:hypothetical protein NIIDMKKI_61410 [Mycobacterium kansasii]
MPDRRAQQAGKRQLLLVVEVVLAAEEDHFMGQQCLTDLVDLGGIEVTAKAYTVHLGADTAAQLLHGYQVCHCMVLRRRV